MIRTTIMTFVDVAIVHLGWLVDLGGEICPQTGLFGVFQVTGGYGVDMGL